MFTILACGDLYGQKVNLELTFPALPTIGELTRKAEESFTQESQVLPPPPGCPPQQGEFKISRVQIYDDVLLKWVDLISSTQLHEYDQVYVFQPQTPWHSDSQQDLPAPRPPSGATGMAGAPQQYAAQPPPQYSAPPQQQQYAPPPQQYAPPQQQYSAPPAHSQGPPPQQYGNGAPTQQYYKAADGTVARPDLPPEQKADVVFRDLDQAGKGFIEYAELERSFRECGLDFSANTVGELFYKADLNRDGRVTPDEWANWARIYPNTLDCMYFRAKNTGEEAVIRGEVQRAEDQLQQNEQAAAMLRRELAELAASSDACRQRAAEQERALAEFAQRKMTLTAEERDLLEEEIKLERQRDQMRMQQARFREVSDRFDRDAQQKGSPRRARDVPPGY